MQFVEDGITGATRFVEVENAITELEEKIKNREAALFVYAREIMLAR